jgi:hypothetical protein
VVSNNSFLVTGICRPVIFSGIIVLLTGPSPKTAIIVLIAGGAAGIVVAEYIRRKIGLDVFFGRIYGPNQMDDIFKKKKNVDQDL